MPIPHPAPFPNPVLEVLRTVVPRGLVLDPLGGIGRLGRLGPGWQVVTSDIEAAWAAQGPQNGTVLSLVADARHLPFLDNSFDAIASSPSYGNRLSDHDASQQRGMIGGLQSDRTRRTYRRYLGRNLHPANGGGLHWGEEYRELHRAIWEEVRRVLKPWGTLVLNVKDHVRNGKRQHVVEWHHRTLLDLGFLRRGGISISLTGDQNMNRLRKQGRETVDEEDVSVWMFQ